MEKQKTKLGARILSKEELNAILPNAESVYEQIEAFRNNISVKRSAQDIEQHEIEQKTNNIGIMGCRGAGKTSVLKTFYHKLKSETGSDQETGGNKRNGDVILPIIIPENMSAGMMLMDAVLGRLKSIIEEREEAREKDKYQGDCIYSGYDSLEKQYNELVKQYCYIKKDYRDILIQEFTTEQNYVDKTKKVFSSDSEFIKLFHQFVDNLLQGKENPMLFLFIDDVDLSANRCMDIVRTLLVYLSHPRIVTFISGDMKTFEEELTLEFLRQEGALSKDVFEATYYTVIDDPAKSSLLESKKTLAYEYLKKIIPPAYRRTIRYWALEERGNYRIEGEEGNASQNLAELLAEVTKEKLENLYFVYKEDGGQNCMRLAFYMLDDTARGLNNVYNVLQEIYDIQRNEKDITDRQKTLLLWQLIETMMDSKPLYAGHKSELLTKIIVLGQEQVKIDFENAYRLLYGDEKEDQGEQGEINADGVAQQTIERFTAKERFAMFYLIDFAARLFCQDKEEESKYADLKRRVIQEYISDEEIDGKIASKKKLLACIVKEEIKKENNPIPGILIDFLKNLDFVVTLHLIRYLGRAEIYYLLEDNKKRYDVKAAAYKIAYAFLKAGQAVSESEEAYQNSLTGLWSDLSETMLSLLNQLSLNPWVIYGRRLTADVSVKKDKIELFNDGEYGWDLAEASFRNVEHYLSEIKIFIGEPTDFLWAAYKNHNAVYWIYYENQLREKEKGKYLFDLKSRAKEMILAGLTKTIMNLLQKRNVMKQFEIGALEEAAYGGILEGKEDKEKGEIQVIEQIDRRELWDSAYVKRTVSPYLEKRRDNYVNALCRGRIIFEATQFVTETYAALADCYKGVSGTAVIYKLKDKIRSVLFLLPNGEKEEQRSFPDGKYYLRLEQALIVCCLLEEFLHFHWRAYYGKQEARKLLMEVKELPLLPHTAKWDEVDEELRNREEAFFEKNLNILGDKDTKEVEDKYKWPEIIDEIRKIWYGKAGETSEEEIKNLVKKYLGEEERKVDYRYLRHLMQKSQIEYRKETQNEEGKVKWSDIEQPIPQKDYLFIFHSYLRDLQANDHEAKNAGMQAEEVARMAQYILDSEIRADEEIQNDFYRMINEELSLTEEEFEKLF